jgi:hypothetical protein
MTALHSLILPPHRLISVLLVRTLPLVSAVSREDGLVTALRSTMKANPEHLQQGQTIGTARAQGGTKDTQALMRFACSCALCFPSPSLQTGLC